MRPAGSRRSGRASEDAPLEWRAPGKESTEILLRGGWPPGRRTAAAELGIPGAREATAAGLLTREYVVVDRPLGARHLVEHFDAVAVGVAQVDAERDAVVDDALYRLSLGLELLIERLEVVEAFEA